MLELSATHFDPQILTTFQDCHGEFEQVYAQMQQEKQTNLYPDRKGDIYARASRN